MDPLWGSVIYTIESIESRLGISWSFSFCGCSQSSWELRAPSTYRIPTLGRALNYIIMTLFGLFGAPGIVTASTLKR